MTPHRFMDRKYRENARNSRKQFSRFEYISAGKIERHWTGPLGRIRPEGNVQPSIRFSGQISTFRPDSDCRISERARKEYKVHIRRMTLIFEKRMQKNYATTHFYILRNTCIETTSMFGRNKTIQVRNITNNTLITDACEICILLGEAQFE